MTLDGRERLEHFVDPDFIASELETTRLPFSDRTVTSAQIDTAQLIVDTVAELVSNRNEELLKRKRELTGELAVVDSRLALIESMRIPGIGNERNKRTDDPRFPSFTSIFKFRGWLSNSGIESFSVWFDQKDLSSGSTEGLTLEDWYLTRKDDICATYDGGNDSRDKYYRDATKMLERVVLPFGPEGQINPIAKNLQNDGGISKPQAEERGIFRIDIYKPDMLIYTMYQNRINSLFGPASARAMLVLANHQIMSRNGISIFEAPVLTPDLSDSDVSTTAEPLEGRQIPSVVDELKEVNLGEGPIYIRGLTHAEQQTVLRIRDLTEGAESFTTPELMASDEWLSRSTLFRIYPKLIDSGILENIGKKHSKEYRFLVDPKAITFTKRLIITHPNATGEDSEEVVADLTSILSPMQLSLAMSIIEQSVKFGDAFFKRSDLALTEHGYSTDQSLKSNYAVVVNRLCELGILSRPNEKSERFKLAVLPTAIDVNIEALEKPKRERNVSGQYTESRSYVSYEDFGIQPKDLGEDHEVFISTLNVLLSPEGRLNLFGGFDARLGLSEIASRFGVETVAHNYALKKVLTYLVMSKILHTRLNRNGENDYWVITQSVPSAKKLIFLEDPKDKPDQPVIIPTTSRWRNQAEVASRVRDRHQGMVLTGEIKDHTARERRDDAGQKEAAEGKATRVRAETELLPSPDEQVRVVLSHHKLKQADISSTEWEILLAIKGGRRSVVSVSSLESSTSMDRETIQDGLEELLHRRLIEVTSTNNRGIESYRIIDIT